MVKSDYPDAEIGAYIPDIWNPLSAQQRAFLAQHYTIHKYKKNETIYCEGENPSHLICLLKGKVKITPSVMHSARQKDGAGRPRNGGKKSAEILELDSR